MGVKVDYANKINAQDLDTIYITGGGFIRRAFKGVSRDSAWGWEETVWGNLNRSASDFSLTNIDKVNFGLVARCEISFKYMNVQDYIDLCKIAKQRFVYVDFLNRETGQRVTQEMAFTGNELGKLYAFGTDYIGNQDVRIKLVATNRENAGVISKEFSVQYDNNGGTGAIASDTARWSEILILSDNQQSVMTKEGYHLKQWNTKQDGTGEAFGLGQQLTVWKDYKLYAIWEASL